MSKLSNAFFWLCVFIFTFNQCATESNLKNTGLFDFKKYFNDVMQTFVNDLEELPFCKLKMKDYSQDINETLYQLEVIGKLVYTNGFLISINNSFTSDTIHGLLSNINQTATIQGELTFEHVKFVYDVEGQLESGTVKGTGMYTIKQFLIGVKIEKDLTTNITTSSMSKTSIKMYEPVQRMTFVPNNDVTTVFGRKFSTLEGVSETLGNWAKEDFQPILQKIVTTKFSFPEIDYDVST